MRRLGPADIAETIAVYRASYDERLPWLAGRHTAEEDRAFFADVMFAQCYFWGEHVGGQLVGIMGLKPNWVEQLYVLPAFQGRGIGRALLEKAKEGQSHLELLTFKRNLAARRFLRTQWICLVA